MRSAFILGLVAIAGCASSPSYRSPALQVPTSFREARDTAGGTSHVAVMTSTSVSESVHQAPRSTYWEQLGDTTLNRLIADLVRANQDVQAPRLAYARRARSACAPCST